MRSSALQAHSHNDTTIIRSVPLCFEVVSIDRDRLREIYSVASTDKSPSFWKFIQWKCSKMFSHQISYSYCWLMGNNWTDGNIDWSKCEQIDTFENPICETISRPLLGISRREGRENTRNFSSLTWVSENSANSRDQNSPWRVIVGGIDETIIASLVGVCTCFLQNSYRLRAAVGNNCWVDSRALPLTIERHLRETVTFNGGDVSGRPSKIGPASALGLR